MVRTVIVWHFIWILLPLGVARAAGEKKADTSVFDRDNLVAWCIVPFDASRRGPEERARMLRRLELRKAAYDWREEHVPSFEEEIIAYRKHGIEFFAFWGWHPDMAPLIRKHSIRPQIWITLKSPEAGTQKEKVESAAKGLLPLVETTRDLGLELGLYNHGAWGGEPANMVAVCKQLREHHDADHAGIVYNLHHGHGHIEDFPEVLEAMKPYLLCLNLNGMNPGARPKILPIGQGLHDGEMLRAILESGYSGPVGILDHRAEVDAEKSLKENLDGLERLQGELNGTRLGPRERKASTGADREGGPSSAPRCLEGVSASSEREPVIPDAGEYRAMPSTSQAPDPGSRSRPQG